MARLVTSSSSTISQPTAVSSSGTKTTSTVVPYNSGSFPESGSTYNMTLTLGNTMYPESNQNGTFKLSESIIRNDLLTGWHEGEVITSSETGTPIDGPVYYGSSGSFNSDFSEGLISNPIDYDTWFQKIYNDVGSSVYRNVSLSRPSNSQGASFLYVSIGDSRSDQPPSFGSAGYDTWNRLFKNSTADWSQAFWNVIQNDSGNREAYVSTLQRHWRFTSRVFYVKASNGFFRCTSTANYGTTVNYDLSGIRINQNGFAYNTDNGTTETGSVPLTVGQLRVQAWTRDPIVTTRTVYPAAMAVSALATEANSYWNRAMVGSSAPDVMTNLSEYTGLPSTAYIVENITATRENRAVIKYLKQPPSGYEYNLTANINVPSGIVVSNNDDTYTSCMTTDFNHYSYYLSEEAQNPVNIPWGWFKDITVNADIDGSIITAKIHREGISTGSTYQQALIIGVPYYGAASAQGSKTFTFNLDLTNGEIDNTTFGGRNQNEMFAIFVSDTNLVSYEFGGIANPPDFHNGRRANWTLNITGGLGKLKGRKIKYQDTTKSVTFLNTGKNANETYIVGSIINVDLNDALAEELSSGRTTRTNLTAVYINDTLLADGSDYTFDINTKELLITASVDVGDVVEVIH